MKRVLLIILGFLPFVGTFGQRPNNLQLDAGLHLGGSVLFHNTNFRPTALGSLYETIALSFPPSEYTYEQFVEDYDIKSTVSTFRYSVSGSLSYKPFPFFVRADVGSSTSGYQKLCIAGTIGLQYSSADQIHDFFWKGSLGFKRVFRDTGFGSETMVNSIGNDLARSYIVTYFDPYQALGSQSGNLLSMNLSVNKFIDFHHKSNLGLEIYGELDLTNETVRQSRMTNVGLGFNFNF